LRRQLDEYLRFLRSLECSDHRFHGKYLWESGEGWGSPSPYADGEILLALVNAARYAGHRDVRATVLRSADAAYLAYADPVLQGSRDSSHEDRAKGFFQWGCMAYVELVESGWPGSDAYSSRAIRMAHWMIDVHGTLQRRRNTSYAQEGIIAAYQLACLAGDRASGEKFRSAVAQGLGRLTTWQIGGPVPCTYLRDNRTDDPRSVGGVLDAPADPMLRIDTTQHQMHAVILARRHVFRDEGPLRDGNVE
jgi:UDP-N-acetylmuramoyl-tripeptide--D-alanyl-D-alanine ligase